MLNWYRADRDADRLIAKAKYPKAIKLLREMLAEDPHDHHVRKKLADVLALAGKRREAANLLEGMVQEYADDGFVTKAIAVVKKIQRIDPERDDLDVKLAGLTQNRGISLLGPASATDRPPAPVPAEVETILRSPLFTDCNASEIQAFIHGLSLLTFQPGEIVISEGEPGSSLLVLASGRVRVYVKNDLGRQVQVRELGAGEFFGEISMLTGKARSATVVAATACDVLELGQHTLEEIGHQHPRVQQVIREFCEKRAQSPEEVQARHKLEMPL